MSEASQEDPAAQAAADAAVRRLVHLAFLGTAAGTLVGTATVVLAMLGVLRLQAASAPSQETGLLLIVGGTFGGLVVGGAAAWWLLSPLRNWYRQGMLATVSAFATVLAMLLAFPIRGLAGSRGLLLFAAACLVGALFLARRARSLFA